MSIIQIAYSVLLLVFFSLNLNCIQSNSTEIETKPSESENKVTDTLRFTSGIRSIFQDSKGRLWFGSLQEGVAVLQNDTFTYYTHEDGLTDNQIHSIQEDNEGVIWLDTQNGVCSFNAEKISDRTPQKNNNVVGVIGEIYSDDKWIKEDADLWFEAGINEGVYRYDGEKLNFLSFPNMKKKSYYSNVYAVTDICMGSDYNIWIATYAGVYGFNGEEFVIIDDELLQLDTETEPLHVRSILEDSQGRLWIGNNGIGVLLKQGTTITNFSEDMELIDLFSGRRGDQSPPGTLEHVFTISEDSEKNIWFGDRDAGIWRYDGNSLTNFTIKDGLYNDFALSIYEDRERRLWFGMADGSIYTFDGNNFREQF